MAEWQIISNDDGFPEPPAEEPAQAKTGSWRRWLLIGGIGLFLGAAGFFTLRRYRAEGQAALRDDLAAHIFEEETRRSLDRPDEGLTMPDVPSAWAEAYWRTFQRSEPPPGPGSILLTEIDFDGQCAVVTLELEGKQEVRAYCLQDQSWRRAPVIAAAWGNEQPPLELPHGLRLHFRARDQLFAETLARDLVVFFDQLDRLAQEAMTFPKPINIVIEPHDLQAPLLLTETGRIVINSPWLTPLQAETGLAGEAAVRLALAKQLLQQAGLFPMEPEATLPGASRFMEAAQTVMAAHLLLPSEIQDSLVESWRVRLAGRWVSPFFANPFPPPELALLSHEANASARLMADYIYRFTSPEALYLIVQQLSSTNSWDNTFQTTLDRLTVDLERETALYAQARLDETETLIPGDPSAMPLTATLLDINRSKSTHLTASFQLPGRSTALLVEIPVGLPFRTMDGDPLEAGCVVAGGQAEITGEWLEYLWRLKATKVIMQEANPLAIEPAPEDTVAYILAGPSYEPYSLVAIRRDGSPVMLAPLANLLLQVFALPMTATDREVHFLFRFDLPACNGVWFAHYEPSKGITGYWLAPPEPLQWVWRADKHDLVFFRSGDDKSISDVYISDRDFMPESMGALADPPPAFVGWHVQTDQFVFYTFDFDATAIGLFDFDTGAPTFQSYYLLLRGRRLSPDGNWLAYVSSGRRSDFVPDRLELINLTDQSIIVPLRVRVKEGVAPPVWSLYLNQPRLAIMAGPAEDYDPLPIPTRLLVLSLDQQTDPQIVARAGEGEEFASPVFCSDGALLYQAHSGETYRLLRQMPGQEAETLFTADQPFHPLACP